jgi:hypothetical protein
VLIDGREVARTTALLGPGSVDAQGRFAAGAATSGASTATLLAFAAELPRQLGGIHPLGDQQPEKIRLDER